MLEHIVRIADVKDLPIKKSTLYKWNHYKKHPEIFSKIDGMLFVDLLKLKALLEG